MHLFLIFNTYTSNMLLIILIAAVILLLVYLTYFTAKQLYWSAKQDELLEKSGLMSFYTAAQHEAARKSKD